MNTPNIGLQRTAPCGLAAEAGSFGAGIGLGGRIRPCAASRKSRRSSPGSRLESLPSFGRGSQNMTLSSGTGRSRRTPREASSTGSQPKRSRSIAGAKPANFEAFCHRAFLALPGRPSRTGSTSRPREFRAPEGQSSPSLHLKKVGRFWSVRVGLSHRALGTETDDRVTRFWIGTHAEYDRLVGWPTAGGEHRLAAGVAPSARRR